MAVADSGKASVIHHAAISQTSPAAGQAAAGIPPGAGRNRVARKPAMPTQKPIRRAVIPAFPQQGRPHLRRALPRSSYFGDTTISIWRPSMRG